MASASPALVVPQPTTSSGLYWVVDVEESCEPLHELHPIWVRHGTHQLGEPPPHPERHPYCEFGILLEGAARMFIEGHEAERLPGDLLLAGPGVPHWGKITEYPVHFITVYFLPSVLVELGLESDGPKLLRRFTARQSAREHIVRPDAQLREHLTTLFEKLAAEFEGRQFGRELKLRILLVEQLVEFVRWEQRKGHNPAGAELAVDWKVVGLTLEYLRKNYAEPVYAQNLARAIGVSQSRLKVSFKNALGLPWCKYLQMYRVRRAVVLLIASHCTVSEAAYATGFESLSHFNAVFRAIMGHPPSEYLNHLHLENSRPRNRTRGAGAHPEPRDVVR
ncbi:MAG: helix-turn-helix domain-containing protein [Verrucomicrobiota bacterium]|jgi:AraC-like DNA-binding protein